MNIRYATLADKESWCKLDTNLPSSEFIKKVGLKQGYSLINDEGKLIGLLRYNLFWDNTPFCTMVYVSTKYRDRGYGSDLIEFWESDMKSKGYTVLLTSIQVDEDAHMFCRKLGYKDCGGFVINLEQFTFPMEVFMVKAI